MDVLSARVYQSGDGPHTFLAGRFKIIDGGLKPFAAGLQLIDVPL